MAVVIQTMMPLVFPLLVEIYKPDEGILGDWKPTEPNAYSGTHGLEK